MNERLEMTRVSITGRIWCSPTPGDRSYHRVTGSRDHRARFIHHFRHHVR